MVEHKQMEPIGLRMQNNGGIALDQMYSEVIKDKINLYYCVFLNRTREDMAQLEVEIRKLIAPSHVLVLCNINN